MPSPLPSRPSGGEARRLYHLRYIPSPISRDEGRPPPPSLPWHGHRRVLPCPSRRRGDPDRGHDGPHGGRRATGSCSSPPPAGSWARCPTGPRPRRNAGRAAAPSSSPPPVTVLGVARHEYLGYGDSGMAGEPTNDDPACFWQADVDEAAGTAGRHPRRRARRCLRHLRRERRLRPPRPHPGAPGGTARRRARRPRPGVHGHGRTATTCCRWPTGPTSSDLDMPDEQRSMLDTMGVPAERITTAVDVQRLPRPASAGAMEAHASQISDTSFFLTMPPEAFAAVWGHRVVHPRRGRRRHGPRGLAARRRHDPGRGADHNVPAIVVGRAGHPPRLPRLPPHRASTASSTDVSEDDARRPIRGVGHHAARARQAPDLGRGLLGANGASPASDVARHGDGFDLEPTTPWRRSRRPTPRRDDRPTTIVAACPDLDQPLALGRHGLTAAVDARPSHRRDGAPRRARRHPARARRRPDRSLRPASRVSPPGPGPTWRTR